MIRTKFVRGFGAPLALTAVVAPHVIVLRQRVPTPPDKPPAYLAQHPAGFPLHSSDAA